MIESLKVYVKTIEMTSEQELRGGHDKPPYP